MTNAEVIEFLKIERDHMTPTLLTERIEAMDMAISALQAQETCEDTVSRQAAIDAFWQSKVEFRPSQIDEVMRILERLPSAQPEIIHCRDCKHWQSEEHIGNNNVHTLNIANLPCKNWLTGGDWYCGSAERRTDEQDD